MSLEGKFAFSPGIECSLGIRPEHLIIHHHFPADAQLCTFEAEVRSVEFIGHETLLYFETAGTLKCCRTSAAATVKAGDRVRFGFSATHVLTFDPQGNRR